MKCPACAMAELVHDTRDIPYSYKGEATFIPAISGDFALRVMNLSWMLNNLAA